MKVLCCHATGGAFKYITTAYRNTFISCGHEFMFWDGNMETLKKYEPDLYIGSTGWKQPIPHSRNFKIVLHTNPFCNTKVAEPGVVISDSKGNINWVNKIKPDAIFGYGLQDEMDEYWASWDFLKIPMPTACDITQFNMAKPSIDLVCNIAYVGNYFDYKARSMNIFILPLVEPFNIRVYGGGWPQKVSGGHLPEEKVAALFASAKVCICVSEPHTHRYGIDMPERIFKVIGAGSFAISDPAASVAKFFGNCVPVATSQLEMEALCRQFIGDDDGREELRAKQYKTVIEKHTYHHRFLNLLRVIKMADEADSVSLYIDNYIKKSDVVK